MSAATMIYGGLIAWVFILALVGGFLVVTYAIEAKRDRRWAAEHATEPVSDEWLAVLKATDTPLYAALCVEQMRDELADDGGLYEWLNGGSS